MILLYKTLTEAELRSVAAEAVAKTKEFFIANPRRRVCRVGVWYGRVLAVSKARVEQDIQLSLEAVLEEQANKSK